MSRHIFQNPTTVILRCDITESLTGVSADPTVMSFWIKEPNNSETYLTYDPDAQGVTNIIQRTSPGKYRVRWNATRVGTYTYEFRATGTFLGTQRGSFTVK
jgi:hypothetical protein